MATHFMATRLMATHLKATRVPSNKAARFNCRTQILSILTHVLQDKSKGILLLDIYFFVSSSLLFLTHSASDLFFYDSL